VLLLQLPKLYGRYRVCLLTVLRLLIAVASTKTSSWCLQAQGYAAGTARESSLTSTLLVQLLLATNTVHIPLLAVRLPMPILLQLLLTAAQPLLLLWAGITRGEGGPGFFTRTQRRLSLWTQQAWGLPCI
jgi:hypothetical protein